MENLKAPFLRTGDVGNRESNDLYWWFGEEYCAFRRNAKYIVHLEQHQSEWNLQRIITFKYVTQINSNLSLFPCYNTISRLDWY